MSVQLIRKVRTSQPNRITSASEFWKSQGLVALFDTVNAVEVIFGQVAKNRTSLSATSKLGLSADFSSTANQQYAHKPDYAITGDITIVALCDDITLSSYSGLIAKQGTTTTYSPYEFRLGNGPGDGNTALLRADSSGYSSTYGVTANITTGFSGVIAVTHKLSGTAITYANNALSNHNAASTTTPADNGSDVWIGRRYDGVTQLDGKLLYVALFNRALNNVQIRSIVSNPWQIFEPETIPLFFSTVTAQFLRPISDVSNSGWTPSSGSDLFAMLNETVRNDATYISATAPGAIFEVLLGTSDGDPQSSINHLPSIVMSAGSGGIILRLKQGTTLIREWTYASLATSDTLYTPTLTSGEIDSITDYTNLRLYAETTA
jgi:hypothetical protein